MIKRLLKIAIDAGSLDDEQISVDMRTASDMIKLKQLDTVDVKLNKCPNCKYSPLKKQDDVLICPSCASTYKLLEDGAYLIS